MGLRLQAFGKVVDQGPIAVDAEKEGHAFVSAPRRFQHLLGGFCLQARSSPAQSAFRKVGGQAEEPNRVIGGSLSIISPVSDTFK